MEKQKSTVTITSINKNSLHPPPVTLSSLPNDLLDPEIAEFIQKLSIAKLAINTNLPTLTTPHTNNIQMSPTNIDREVFSYNEYYNENELFGHDFNGNIVIGAVHSPRTKHNKNHSKSNSLSQSLTKEDYSEIFAFPDIGNNNNKSVETLIESKESDNNFKDVTKLFQQNKDKISENIRNKQSKRKHKQNSSSSSSIDLPIPRQSTLELQIEEEKFDEKRQKYIADMVHEMFSDDEDYQSDSIEQNVNANAPDIADNFDGTILELDTNKILKGMKKKKSVMARVRPSQLCLRKSLSYDKTSSACKQNVSLDKYNKLEQELMQWKNQCTQLNKQYTQVLERNGKLNESVKVMEDTLQKSENQRMMLLLNAKDNEELVRENNALKVELKKYKSREGIINDQITWISSKYKLKGGKNGKDNVLVSEEEVNNSETDDESEIEIDHDMFAEIKKHEFSDTMIFNEDNVTEIQLMKSVSNGSASFSNNKFLVDEIKFSGESYGEIEKEDDYKFVNECRNMFKDGNILGATMNIELIETCHRSVIMFYEIKGKFMDFVKQSERVQLLFDNLQKCDNMHVNAKICEYDEIYKLWMEFIERAKEDIAYIENMKKKALDYTFYDGISDDNYSDVEYDFDETVKSEDESNDEYEYEEYEEEYNENDMHYDFEYMMDVN